METNLYWECRRIYALVCDLVEEENNITIEKTKNAEKFYSIIKEKLFEEKA